MQKQKEYNGELVVLRHLFCLMVHVLKILACRCKLCKLDLFNLLFINIQSFEFN
jgi:hypothetical protein